MKPEDLEPGKSYACKFRVRTYLTDNNTPLDTSSIPQDPSEWLLGEWESWGLIARRDSQARLLEVNDENCTRTWTLSYDDVWDIDVAYYKQ
jgi:hypothetical protein